MERLVNRGHHLTDLTPIFVNAANSLDNTTEISKPPSTSNTLYMQWTFHPNDLQRKDIRNAYNKTLQPFLSYDKMTVAISRPPNL